MKTVFADSNYFIALLNPHDELHERAKSVSSSLGDFRLVTTELVLAEVLNYYGEYGPALRSAAVLLMERLVQNERVVIEPQTSTQFSDALALFAQRLDKTWSLTDCASFLAMQERNVGEALTYDKDFEQAGFKALLRDSNA